MTKDQRFFFADILFRSYQHLMTQYPGYWTMRMDLTLRPEKYDELDENHFYSFSTTRVNSLSALKCALNLLQERLGEAKFDTLVNNYLGIDTASIS